MALTGTYMIKKGRISLFSSYLKVDKVTVRSDSRAEININVFKDRNEKESSGSICEMFMVACEGADFDRFFSDTELKKTNSSPINNAYAYIKTIEPYSELSDV